MISVFLLLNFITVSYTVIVYFSEKHNIQIHLNEKIQVYNPTGLYIFFPAFALFYFNNLCSLCDMIVLLSGSLSIHIGVLAILYLSAMTIFYISTFDAQNKIVENISWDKNYYLYGTIIYIITGFINPFQFIVFYIIDKFKFNIDNLSNFKIINKIQNTIKEIENRRKDNE